MFNSCNCLMNSRFGEMRYYRKVFRSAAVIIVLLTLFTSLIFTNVLAVYAAETEVPISKEETAENVETVKALAQKLYNENNFATQNGGYNYISGNTYPRGNLFTWDSESRTSSSPKYRSWTYYNGIMMDAFLMMDDTSFRSKVIAFYDANIINGKVDQTKPNNSTYNKNKYAENELDSIPPARALFDLIKSGSVSDARKSNYKQMIYYVYSILSSFPKADGTNNTIFKHKYNNSNWDNFQVGLDGLYMAQPFLMEIANCLDSGNNLLDSSKFPDSDELYTSVYNSMVWVRDKMYNENLGLYNHGWGQNPGTNGHYWLRGIGWYAAALADVISMMPDETYRNHLIEIEKELFDGMMEHQNSETGMWRNVVNCGSSVPSESQENKFESSGTALMAYAMMKLYSEGYIDDDQYGESGLKAFNGTVINKMTSGDLEDVYRSSGVETTDAGYLKSTYETNEAKGVAPLMMAASYANAVAEQLNVASVSYTVTFKVANGSWNDKTTEDKTVTLTGKEGDELKLTGEQIPQAGNEPGANYKPGSWNPVPSTESVISADTTYTYTYAEKGIPQVTAPKAKTLTYNGSEQTLADMGSSTGGTMQYALGESMDAAPAGGWNDNVPAARDAGTYYLWYKVAGDNDYMGVEPASIEVTIAKKPVTVSGITAAGKEYDGTTNADIDTSKATFNGIVEGDKLTISAQGSFADSYAGAEKTVYISELKLGGESVANYELASEGQQASATASITKKAVIIKAHDQTVPLYGSVSSELKNVMVSEPNGEDDGHQISTEQNGVLIINGFPNHKLVSVTLKSSDTDSFKDDGEITPGDAVIKNGGEDVTFNFDITYKNGVLTVEKGIITITENPQAEAITYGQKLKHSVLSGGRVNDGKVDVKGTFTWKDKDTVPSVSDSNTTKYDVIFKPENDNNYDEKPIQITLEVRKADQSAPAAPELEKASLSEIKLTPVDGYEYSMDGEHWQTSNVFTGLTMVTEYSFYQRKAGDENHNASPSSPAAQFRTGAHVHEWTYQANGAVLTETCSNTDGGHEGQTQSSLTIAAPAHKVYGDGLEAAASISGSISGTDKPAIVYAKGSEMLQSPPTDPGTYTASITAGGATASVSYTIAPKEVTVTAKDQTIREGESITAGPGQAVLAGALSGHSLSQVSLKVDEDHKKINPSDAVISDDSGNDLTANYKITFKPGTLTVKSPISRTVRFIVKNGSWNNGSNEAVEIVLSGYEGDELKLTAGQIPSAGTHPAEGFQAGGWDRVPDIQTVITGDTEYTYSYVSSQGGDTPDTPSGGLKVDEAISVSGLSTGDKAGFYQVLKFDPSAAATGGWVNSTGFTLTEDEIQKILGIGDYAEGKAKADQAGIDEAIAAKIADMAEAVTAKYPDIAEESGTAKQTSPEAGLYVVLISPKNPGDIYNPVFVGADYQTNSSHTWEVTITDSYQPASMAKKGKVTLEKTASTFEDLNEDKNAATVAMGDTVSFTVKTKIPEFASNYTKAVFKISDTLSKGLSLKADTLKVYAAADASDASKLITAGPGTYTPAITAGDKDTAGSYTINFATAYLLGLNAAQDIFVTYDAIVTSEADASVNVLDNTVVVNFSNFPTDETGKGTLKDETKHYTFDIDGNLLGEESYKATELVKVAVDANGNEITETRALSNGKKVGALQGAEFKLYKAEECEDTDEYRGNELFKNGAIIVSDEDGRLTVQGQTKPGIRGLDAGTYYLREMKAPDGYIKAQDPVKIEIIPTYKTTTKTETADGIQISWDYQELDGYVVKIANVITASYTMTNEKPDHGDTVVGTDGTSGKIQNTQGVELPSTGGSGTWLYTILGSILIFGAGVLLRRRWRTI